jgi:hypothetical protein
MKHHFRPRWRTIAAININLMTAAACAFIAWAIWPSKPDWWGFGLMSIILSFAAIGGLGKALIAAAGLRAKEAAINDYVAQGGAPKAARMASIDDLKRAGMIE